MNEPFTLFVNYHGQELELKALFARWGYTHRITVLIEDNQFAFEPDEAGQYRVLADASNRSSTVETGLLQAIATTLVKLGQLS